MLIGIDLCLSICRPVSGSLIIALTIILIVILRTAVIVVVPLLVLLDFRRKRWQDDSVSVSIFDFLFRLLRLWCSCLWCSCLYLCRLD